jgi:rubrerythrin
LPENNSTFNEYEHLLQLVDFAISREQEAAAFYHELAAKVQNESITSELRRMAAMEEEHKTRFEKLNIAESASSLPPEIENLKIDNYRVAVKPDVSMSSSDVLQLALQRETASMKLYSDMANLLPDSLLKRLLLNLVKEESLHYRYLERLMAENQVILPANG